MYAGGTNYGTSKGMPQNNFPKPNPTSAENHPSTNAAQKTRNPNRLQTSSGKTNQVAAQAPKYVTDSGASQAGKGMRSGDPEERKAAAAYMAKYRNKKRALNK